MRFLRGKKGWVRILFLFLAVSVTLYAGNIHAYYTTYASNLYSPYGLYGGIYGGGLYGGFYGGLYGLGGLYGSYGGLYGGPYGSYGGPYGGLYGGLHGSSYGGLYGGLYGSPYGRLAFGEDPLFGRMAQVLTTLPVPAIVPPPVLTIPAVTPLGFSITTLVPTAPATITPTLTVPVTTAPALVPAPLPVTVPITLPAVTVPVTAPTAVAVTPSVIVNISAINISILPPPLPNPSGVWRGIWASYINLAGGIAEFAITYNPLTLSIYGTAGILLNELIPVPINVNGLNGPIGFTLSGSFFNPVTLNTYYADYTCTLVSPSSITGTYSIHDVLFAETDTGSINLSPVI